MTKACQCTQLNILILLLSMCGQFPKATPPTMNFLEATTIEKADWEGWSEVIMPADVCVYDAGGAFSSRERSPKPDSAWVGHRSAQGFSRGQAPSFFRTYRRACCRPAATTARERPHGGPATVDAVPRASWRSDSSRPTFQNLTPNIWVNTSVLAVLLEPSYSTLPSLL